MNTHTTYQYYRVAGHTFRLSLPPEGLPETMLENYAPFHTEPDDTSLLFTFSIVEQGVQFPPIARAVIQIESKNRSIDVFHTTDGGIRINLSTAQDTECCRFYSDIHSREVLIQLGGSPEEQKFGLDNCLMLVYTFTACPLETLLVNASVIEDHGKGYLFAGRAGMNGNIRKFCQEWLKCTHESILLDDEISVIRITDEDIWVYSTPWNNPESYHGNRRVPLKAVIQLMQSPCNRISSLSHPAAYASLLSACWSMKWSDTMIGSVHHILERLTARTPALRLECTPGEEVVKKCILTLNGRQR